ncbi:MAG: pyocin activator PrtN family protein [Candidatus Thiodiazotropha sp. (ex Codakia rugifera)]|nr:pyocin activator PrtN family protein [Candidatus Thiodiazotropha sp. (ex Codakia rugifera)]
MKNRIEQVSDLEKALEADLLREYGPLLTSNSLRKALGYPSLEALRQAVARNKVPVHVFSLPNRRGKFALAKDVAAWLAEQRNRVDN